jgi:uncharacterized small protein (DUF1192 family)
MHTDRHYAVYSILTNYVRSPSLRHLREPHSLQRVTQEIVQALDRASSVWHKWDGPREDVAKAAVPCWIPVEDLREFLNNLPGPPLTQMDVLQRLRAISEEPWASYPKEELAEGCRTLYEREKLAGTEMSARIGALQEHIEREEERLRVERDETYKKFREDERIRLQQRFISGADCGWTQIEKSKDFFCRRNGRAFRISQIKDKRWSLYRIAAMGEGGILVGTYQGRREASNALQQIAYGPDVPRR